MCSLIILRTLFAVLTIVNRVASYSIEVKPSEKQCFTVSALAVGVPISGSYEIISPDAKYLTVTVVGPKHHMHFEKKPPESESLGKEEEASEGFFSFDSESIGDYELCFANGNRDDNDGVTRLIAFNFRRAPQGEQDYEYVGLQSELIDLRDGLQLLFDHQSYMNQREDVHKMALESINTKVLCWTVLEAVILIAMALWQITYIRSFFEIKRRI